MNGFPRYVICAYYALYCGALAFGGEIHDAVRAGDESKVKAVLKKKPESVNEKDVSGLTPLHWAIRLDKKTAD
jgi:ankyrin repeat protein